MNEQEDSQKQRAHIDVCGTYAALLSLTEVGLGSLLHSLSVPCCGHFLSLNQIFLLSRASASIGKTGSFFLPGSISFVAAALKSLSPAGKKLTPMLAIGMQGLLYNIGILLLGHSALGRVSGAFFSSLWGFIQPLLIYYFIFGQALFQAIIRLEEHIRSWVSFEIVSVWHLFAATILIKVFLAVVIALLAPKTSHAVMAIYTENIAKAHVKPKNPLSSTKQPLKRIALLAAKDLCVWPFAACVVLSTASFWFVEKGTALWLVYLILRPVAVGFLFFFAVRLLPLEKVATWLEEKQFSALGQAFRIALSKVKQVLQPQHPEK